MYRVGGRRYPLRTHPNCHVCQSFEYRAEIENALLKGYSYATVQRSLPPEAKIGVENIRNHVLGQHLPLDEAMRRVVMEERAREVGLSIEDHEGSLVDHIAFAKMGIQRVAERLAKGEIEPDVKDGIALASLLARIEEEAGEGVDNEVMIQAFMVYMEAMRSICTAEQITAIRERIAANPVMAGLMSRARPIPATAEPSPNGHR